MSALWCKCNLLGWVGVKLWCVHCGVQIVTIFSPPVFLSEMFSVGSDLSLVVSYCNGDEDVHWERFGKTVPMEDGLWSEEGKLTTVESWVASVAGISFW